ncbi:MAG: PAS domain S-box protein [Rhodobacteraceae bacterium]|nr:PAS domain S-box protein [Paracoccaceae bacterium]
MSEEAGAAQRNSTRREDAARHGELGEDFAAELRVEQSLHLVGQLPTLVIGNLIGVLIGVLFTVDHSPWYMMLAWLWIAILTVPMALNWLKLRNRPRPASVSKRRLRVAALHSLLLGLSWILVPWLFLPGLPEINQLGVLYGMIVLCAGAVASISALPMAALAYFVPMMSFTFVVTLLEGTQPYKPGAVLAALMFIALPGFLRQNWRTFRRNVAIAVELRQRTEAQRAEVERRIAVERELLAAKEAAEEAAAEVRESKLRVQSIIEALPLPVAIFRMPDDRIVYANRWASELLAVPQAEISESHSTDFLRDRDEVARLVESVRGGKSVIDHETIITRPDGEEVPVRMAAILMDYGGAPAILTVTEDITLRKLNEEQLELARDRAEEANLAKSRFLANMSHELRTPLNAVLGYAELMADGIYGELPPKAGGVLERIQTNGRHLLGLINDVLDLSKIEAGQVELQLQPYRWESVVDSVVAATGSLVEAKGIELRREVADGLSMGTGDERRLTQVLLNLVGNAIKFTDEGHVAISVQERDGQFEISVSDTGPGIAPEDQARIFDEFQQADDSSTRAKGGTGLGLAISKRIVDMHGGHIGVSSTLGKGATFRIRVPVAAEADLDAQKETST